MPPTMTTRSVVRPAAASRGGGAGGRTGRGGGRTRGRSGDQGNGRIDGQGGQQLQNLLPTIVAQVGDQGKGQGNGRNQNGDAVNDNIRIEKMKSVQDMSGCRDSQKVKYIAGSFVGKALTEEFCPSNEMQQLEIKLWNHVMVGAGHAAYNDRFHDLARLVPHLVTLEGMDPSKRTLRREEIRENLVRIGMEGRITRELGLEMPLLQPRTLLGKKNGCDTQDCRVVPRNVNPINARNPIVRACYECGSTDHIKSACLRLNQAQRPGGNHQN
ncbi:hypothetical protein Tco_1140854 [Tanacetum coccineum]